MKVYDRPGNISQIHRSRKFLLDKGREEGSHGNVIQNTRKHLV